MNSPRFESLRKLTPVQAVKAWLDGDFGLGDEEALIEAIRKDNRISKSDDEITDLITDAMGDDKADPQECLDRLALQK